MKFKLDENLGARALARLSAAGHDVSSVPAQNLSGATDSEIGRVCALEARALVTLDFDFSHVLRFPPAQFAGIAVLSARGRMTAALLDRLLDELIAAVEAESLSGKLWIVELGRVRIHADD